MSIEFNRVSLPSFSQMLSGIGEGIPVSLLSDHDRFSSWEYVATKSIAGREQRRLYRCAEGGFMWVDVNGDGIAHKASSVSNDEARQIWIERLLHFTEEEVANLETALKPGVNFNDALESVLGWKRVSRSFHLPGGDRSELNVAGKERLFCAHDGGLISARVADDDKIISYLLIQGLDAWNRIQPLVDPLPREL